MSGLYKGSVTSELEYRVKMETAIRMAIAGYKKRMQSYIEEDPRIPVATGHLKQSGKDVVGESMAKGFGFEAYWGFSADYAKYVDEGRTARYPGVEGLAKIRAWCIVVGIPQEAAEAIAWKLYHYPTPGKFFFEPGLIMAKRVLAEEITSALDLMGISARVAL